MGARVIRVAGGHKLRWRDGTKHPVTGRYVERAGQVFKTKAEALSEKRRIDAQQSLRRELRRRTNRAVMSLGAVLERYIERRLSMKKMRADYAAELRVTLERLFRDQRWTTTADVTAEAIDRWIRTKAGITEAMSGEQRAAAMLGVKGIDKPLQQVQSLLRYARATLRQTVDDAARDYDKPKRPEKAKPPLLSVEQIVDIVLPAARDAAGDVYGEHAEAVLDHARTYGHRWYSLCLVDVADFNATRGTLRLRHVKRSEGGPLVVDLLERHVERYRALARGRAPHEALFLSPSGERWRCHGKATQLVDWYRANVAKLLPRDQRQSYQLKDHAIAEMRRAGVADATIIAIAGTKALDRYDTTNVSEKRLALHAIARRQAQSAPQVRPGGAVGTA